jgi:hypothetical protein
MNKESFTTNYYDTVIIGRAQNDLIRNPSRFRRGGTRGVLCEKGKYAS